MSMHAPLSIGKPACSACMQILRERGQIVQADLHVVAVSGAQWLLVACSACMQQVNQIPHECCAFMRRIVLCFTMCCTYSVWTIHTLTKYSYGCHNYARRFHITFVALTGNLRSWDGMHVLCTVQYEVEQPRQSNYDANATGVFRTIGDCLRIVCVVWINGSI